MKLHTLERPGTAVQPQQLRRGAVRTPGRAARASSRQRRTEWALAVGVTTVLAAALWSYTAVSSAVSPAGPGQLGLVGGVVAVDGVVSAARPQHAMPGMGTDNDPVAEDERRISVDVTLHADEDGTLEYDAERFRLSPEGGRAVAPHKLVLPGDELPAGTSLSGTLVFDVPLDATTASLSYAGESTPLVLPDEAAGQAPPPAAPSPADAHEAGHGS